MFQNSFSSNTAYQQRSNKRLDIIWGWPFILVLVLQALMSHPVLAAENNPNTATLDATNLIPKWIEKDHSASQIIEYALTLWRGKTSYSEVEMLVHRPDWQRQMAMQGWTSGLKNSLIRFTFPPKDSGNATLKLDKNMWLYTPKLNRVNKLPNSMMTQSWMGSDFSYNDLAKTDQVLTHYTAEVTQIREEGKHKILHLRLTPKANAPIVWGKEELEIRDDFVILKETFFDQDMQAVKAMVTEEIEMIQGRPYPTKMKMVRYDKTDHWTQIHTKKALFDIELPSHIFSVSNLKNPAHWQVPK